MHPPVRHYTIDHLPGNVSRPVRKLNLPRWLKVLAGFVFLSATAGFAAAQKETTLHEAVTSGNVTAHISSFAQGTLTLTLHATSPAGALKIRIPAGTWIELEHYRGAGRLHLTEASIDLGRRPNGWFASVQAYPDKHTVLVPVFERSGSTDTEPSGSRAGISAAGFDPVAAQILDRRSSDKADVLGVAAGILMMNRPKLSMSEFRGFVDRYFTRRMTEKQEAIVSGNGREAPLYIWEPTEEHLKMGEHLFEKARFTVGNAPPVATSGSATPMSPSAPTPVTSTLADAAANGFLTATARKGMAGHMILGLTRTPAAPPGPLRVTIPLGTYFLFDDKGDGQPARLYPVVENTADLFGEVAGGAQVPCFNGSYKRRIITTRTLKVETGFDARVASLFEGRGVADYVQMAVELVLLDQSDLSRDQIQYHISRVGVPKTRSLGVTDELVAAARARLNGEAVSAVSAPSETEMNSASLRPEPSSPPQTSPSASPSRRPTVTGETLFGVTRAAGPKGVHVDPNTPNDPGGVLAGSPNGAGMWRKMVEHVPEYPEAEVVGTWISVPEAEARQYVLRLRLDALETAAVATGGTLPDGMRQMIEDKTKLDQKLTYYYTGTLIFSSTGDVGGSVKGPNRPEPRQVRAKWRFDGIQTIEIVPDSLVSKLKFAQNGRLVLHDERSNLLLVLRKH